MKLGLSTENKKEDSGNRELGFEHIGDISEFDKQIALVEEKMEVRDNLREVRDIVAEKGVDATLESLVDTDKQLSDFLGVDMSSEDNEKIVGTLDEKITEIDESLEAEVSTEDWKESAKQWASAVLLSMLTGALAVPAMASGAVGFGAIMGFASMAFSIAALFFLVKTAVEAIQELSDTGEAGSDSEEGSSESLKDKAKVVPAEAAEARFKSVQKGMKLIFKDLENDYENFDLGKYESIMEELGFERAGDKFKGGEKLPKESGTLTELGWSVDRINKLRSKLLEIGESVKKAEDDLKQKKEKIEERSDELKQKMKEAKENADDISEEEKKKAEKQLKQIKEDGKALKDATTEIMKAYRELVKETTKVVKTAQK